MLDRIMLHTKVREGEEALKQTMIQVCVYATSVFSLGRSHVGTLASSALSPLLSPMQILLPQISSQQCSRILGRFSTGWRMDRL